MFGANWLKSLSGLGPSLTTSVCAFCRTLTHSAPPYGMFPAVESPEKLDVGVNRQGLSALHVACLYGQIARIQHLVESGQGWVNTSDLQGRRPVHMVLSWQSSPNTTSCLRYLLEQGADINVKTNSGTTPLHLAASGGLLDCTEILVQAGADVLALDSMGHTPLVSARIWSHRKVARYLKSCMWQEDKKKEMQEKQLVQALYRDLVGMAKQNELNKKPHIDMKMAEWANKKGFPPLKDFSPRVLVSQYHTQCLLSDQNRSKPKHAKHSLKQQPVDNQEERTPSLKQPPASSSKPWTIFMGILPEKPQKMPDLRDSVGLRRDSISKQLQYTTKWDSTPHPTPDLPLDVLERVLFPRAFPSRIASPRHFEPQSITEVQHRGHPQGQSTSPWTEVAMHLAEVLEPGHY